MAEEERIALFLDYENLAIGTREHLRGLSFDLRPIADALAERGRVVVRRAYADWSYFDEDRRMLTRSHVELIEIPQRMGASRKNAADIKMVVDAIELAFVRDYISTFVIATGDSDFTPLVHKLRELNKRVIGVGVRQSTSALLPPACDEFLYYDDLEGVEVADVPQRPARRPAAAKRAARDQATGDQAGAASSASAESMAAGRGSDGNDRADAPAASSSVSTSGSGQAGGKGAAADEPVGNESAADREETGPPDLAVLVAQTVAGLERSQGGEVTASVLKRTLVRKDSTFNESGYGFRAFGELLRHLAARGVIELSDGPAKGDPVVELPERGDRDEAFALLRTVVADLAAPGASTPLSGLKDQVRRHQADFSEKKLGYRSFLQFAKAAHADGAIRLQWSEADEEYQVAGRD